MFDQYISHFLAESPIYLKIGPKRSGHWAAVTFHASDYSEVFTLRLFMNQAGVTSASVDVCGGEARALAECSFSDKSWAILVIAKFELSLEISCNEGESLVYGEECAKTVGDVVEYIFVHNFDDDTLMYLIPHYQGKTRI